MRANLKLAPFAGVLRRSISSTRPMMSELRSSGAIFDPYVYRGPGGTALPSIWSANGLKERWGIMRGHLVSGVSAGIIQKNVPEFHAKKFPPIANGVLSAFLEAHRKGDLSALAGLTTEELHATIKAEIKSASKSREPRGAFRLVGFHGPTHVLQMRHLRKRTNEKEGWGQVTCKLCTERDMVLVDGSGREVSQTSGSANRRIRNFTIGTFEIFFGDRARRWRVALLEELGSPSTDGQKSGDTDRLSS